MSSTDTIAVITIETPEVSASASAADSATQTETLDTSSKTGCETSSQTTTSERSTESETSTAIILPGASIQTVVVSQLAASATTAPDSTFYFSVSSSTISTGPVSITLIGKYTDASGDLVTTTIVIAVSSSTTSTTLINSTTSSTPATCPPPQSTPSASDLRNNSLSTGAKAGIGVGVVFEALLFLAGAVMLWLANRRSRKKESKDSQESGMLDTSVPPDRKVAEPKESKVVDTAVYEFPSERGVELASSRQDAELPASHGLSELGLKKSLRTKLELQDPQELDATEPLRDEHSRTGV